MLADDHETFLATELDTLLFASDETPLQEWEYLPPVGPRPPRGFVGLKNAGATCYMNSVLQQVCFTSSCMCVCVDSLMRCGSWFLKILFCNLYSSG